MIYEHDIVMPSGLFHKISMFSYQNEFQLKNTFAQISNPFPMTPTND